MTKRRLPVDEMVFAEIDRRAGEAAADMREVGGKYADDAVRNVFMRFALWHVFAGNDAEARVALEHAIAASAEQFGEQIEAAMSDPQLVWVVARHDQQMTPLCPPEAAIGT